MWQRWESKARNWLESALKQVKVPASALILTMGDFKERSGFYPNHKFWWDVLIHLEIDPHELIASYDEVTMRYGESHKMFREFADWCKRRN